MSHLLDQIAILQKVSIFKNLSIEELEQIAQITHTEEYDEEELLFRQGDTGDLAYIILSGEVELYLEKNKEQQVLTVLGTGTCFGEMAVLDQDQRSAAARIKTKSLIATFSREDLIRVIFQFPTIALGIITELSARIRGGNNKIAKLQSAVTQITDLSDQLKSEGLA